MTIEPPKSVEEPARGRTIALVIMLMLITVLLYQVIDDVQRRAYQRRRDLRRQQWREWREREFQANIAAATTQPELTDAVPGPDQVVPPVANPDPPQGDPGR